MEDEDGEGSNIDSWSISEQLPYKDTSYIGETLKKANSMNDYIDGIEENKQETSEEKRSNLKVIFKGYKKRILAQTQENRIPEQIIQDTYPMATLKTSKDKTIEGKRGKITEYAQYLGLQPAGKYKCSTCHPAVSFRSPSMLKQHQCDCLGTVNTNYKTPSGSSEQHSTNLSSYTNNFHITRKVYLCSACGTYFENWNLFLHMREIHKRHICLFCLGMFGQAERLSYHLSKKHSVPETNYTSIEDFYTVFKDSCYLICCTCEKVFSETDNFCNHNCNSSSMRTSEVSSICKQTGSHLSTCSLNSSLEYQNKNERIHSTDPERTLLPNPANAVAKKLLNAEKNKLKPNEKILVSSYQKKLSNSYERKVFLKTKHHLADDNHEIRLNRRSSKDKIMENVIQTSKYGVDLEDSRLVLSEDPKDRQTVISSDSEKSYYRYSENFVEASKSSNFWNYHNNTNNEEDDNRLINLEDSLEEGEKGELILDDGKEDSSGDSPPTSPLCIESPVHKLPPNILELSEKSEIILPTEESPSHSVTRVNSNNSRSLIIKICANKNSQFSVQTPNANGTYTNNEINDDEDEDIESNEENVKTGDTEVEKNTSINDRGSDSDSGRLTVALSHSKSDEKQTKESFVNIDHDNGKEKINENIMKYADNKNTEIVVPSESIINLDELANIDILSESVLDVKNNLLETKTDDSNKTEEKFEIQADCDGVILATNDVSSIDFNVAGTLDSMEIDDILKKCIEAASPTCVYCNHARHIAVHGKQLALHMLAEHRFQPQHPAIIIQHEQFVSRVKKSLDDLESYYLNLYSYDTIRGTYDVPTIRTYECYLCRIYYTVYKELYLHNRKMHQKTILICIMCKSTFYNHSELLCHLCPGVYACNVNIRYRCCMCTIESLPSAFRLMVHLRKRHHTCDVCLESTENQQKLSNHVWKHKLHHLCYRCGIAYRNKPDITKHLFWKHGTESVLCKKCLQKKWPHVYHFCIPPNTFVCEECGSTFSRAVALKVHKRLHSGDVPYGCTECSEKFISKRLAIKHEENHKPQVKVSPKIPEGLQELSVSTESNTVTIVSETIGIDVVNDPNVFKESVRKVVDVYDLPPLNLSSDSDSDTEMDVQKKKKENEDKPKTKNEKVKDDKKRNNEKDIGEENDDIKENSEEIVEETLVSELNDNTRENDENNDEQKKEEVVIMNGIWNNFKSYKASLESKESFDKFEDNLITKEELMKLIIAEHDYCIIYTDDLKEKERFVEPQSIEINESESSTLINSINNNEVDAKKKMKSPKKKKQQNDGVGSSSSSDSSSDSDSSSCSCGTNCSCSSSSSESSSSSSSTSDSDSSISETSPKKQFIVAKKNKKKERDNKKNKNKDEILVFQDDDQIENEIRSNEEALNEPTICVNKEVEKTLSVNVSLKESDLETTETETDEDFYDEYPQQHTNKLLTEKRNQSMLLTAVDPPIDDSNFKSASDDMKNGTIETSNVETHSLAISTPLSLAKQISKRKVRTKRRKKSDENRGRGRGRPPGSTNKQQSTTESIKLNIPKFLYRNKSTYISSPNINTIEVNEKDYSVNYEITQPNSSVINQSMNPALPGSKNESINNTNENKRSSKRKRIPKKFYGDSSDEEQRQSHYVTQKWRRVENQIPMIPYIPNITIKQNFGPPSIIQSKIDSLPSSMPEPFLALAPSVTDSEEPIDSSSDSNASERERVMNSTQSNISENYSAPSGPSGPSARSTNLYCFCQCPYDEVSEMIACDGQNCQIEWFHFECVGIMVPPKGKWYCPNCKNKDSNLPEDEC